MILLLLEIVVHPGYLNCHTRDNAHGSLVRSHAHLVRSNQLVLGGGEDGNTGFMLENKSVKEGSRTICLALVFAMDMRIGDHILEFAKELDILGCGSILWIVR